MIDVCLILEATYPYISGGVSTWVHQLISHMKEIRFGIVNISAHPDPTRNFKYDVPNHVIFIKDIFLQDLPKNKKKLRSITQADIDLVESFYEQVGQDEQGLFIQFANLFRGEEACFDTYNFFKNKQIYNLLNKFYKKYGELTSYIDFFWTWRGTHLPILQILQAELPEAKIYHAVSTGYAGMLSAIARNSYKSKYFLTEHGIYTHERMLEISQSSWIFEKVERSMRVSKEMSLFKRWWIKMFQAMSQVAYLHADHIYTLFEGNKTREVLEGADADKISIVPNGIDVNRFGGITRVKKKEPQIGLIGRVVSIKDIKTFINAAKQVLNELPETMFYVVGPTEEEIEYFEECKALVLTLGIEDNFIFTGRQDVLEYYSFLDVVVLTSLSEAQPYIILEGGIAGIPMIATDVGACREMLEGRLPEDKKLGPSGLVTEVSNSKQTAEAILKLITDQEFYKQCSEAAIKRVKKYYDQDDLLSRYLNIYEQNM